jgi:hypothetical protein
LHSIPFSFFLFSLRVISSSFALLSVSSLPLLSSITRLFYSLCQKNFSDSIFKPFPHYTCNWSMGKKST